MSLRLAALAGAALAGACISVEPSSLIPVRGGPPHQERPLLDGSAKSLVVLGDSTSLVWPSMLQDMLDWHSGKRGFVRVCDAAAAGAWIGHWTAEAGSAERARTFDALAEDWFGPEAPPRGAAPAPEIALVQVSLQGLCDRRGPVKAEHDMVGAEMGADALEALALDLIGLGVEHVFFATNVYKRTTEPEVGLERVALQRLLARGHDGVAAGPDVWTPTRDYWPDAYADDGVHPNEFGLKLIAEEWYRFLAGPEAQEEVVQELYATDYDVVALERAALERRERRPSP